jgi:VanZ family protein
MKRLPVMIHFLYYQMPAILMAALIFIVSSMEKIPVIELTFRWEDKLLHAIAYAILAFLTSRALYYQNIKSTWRKNAVVLAVVFAALYGISDEIHQYFVPGRMMDFWDFVADVIGGGSGGGLFLLLIRQKNVVVE